MRNEMEANKQRREREVFLMAGKGERRGEERDK
jgi:hypothetical protein